MKKLLRFNEKIKMKTFGLTLFTFGVMILIYSIFYGSSDMGFWSIYIGVLLLVSGLRFLGLNVGGYPF